MFCRNYLIGENLMPISNPDAELLGTSFSKRDKTNPNKTRNKGNLPPALTISITKKVNYPLKEKEQAQSRPNFVPYNEASRVTSRAYRKRIQNFQNAVLFSERKGLPLRWTLTIAWAALRDAGQRNEGHILAFKDKDRCAVLKKRWARLANRLGFSFVCIWGRAVGPRQGTHIHALFWWPIEAIDTLLDFIRTVTGSEAAMVGITETASECRGWLLKKNIRGLSGARDYGDYIGGQDQRHPSLQTLEGRCFGVSETIGATTQRKEGGRKQSYLPLNQMINASGPLLPFASATVRCGAARQTGHSLHGQKLSWPNSHNAD
jgi:hypothetical protein